MARPTLSRVLYLQQIGRGLRKTSTKSNVIVVDVVDEYAATVAPCSVHPIFQNPCYVPFGDITRRDYKPGEWIEVDGIRERVERIVEIGALSFAEKYEGYLSVEQLARELFVSTDTVGGWIEKGRIEPTVSFSFGSRRCTCSALKMLRLCERGRGFPFTMTRPSGMTSLTSWRSGIIRSRTRWCFRLA